MTADRIFVVAIAIVLLAFCCHRGYSAIRDLRPRGRLNESVPPFGRLRGPAYLTSNLPLYRLYDDTLPVVSVSPTDATATGAAAV